MLPSIYGWHEADFQPYWHGVLLPDNKSAAFSAAGELLDGKAEEIDQYLVYYIDRGDGCIETLTPLSSASCCRGSREGRATA